MARNRFTQEKRWDEIKLKIDPSAATPEQYLLTGIISSHLSLSWTLLLSPFHAVLLTPICVEV
jgi:hypothetical protein